MRRRDLIKSLVVLPFGFLAKRVIEPESKIIENSMKLHKVVHGRMSSADPQYGPSFIIQGKDGKIREIQPKQYTDPIEYAKKIQLSRPLEEAKAIKALVDKGHSIKWISQKINRSSMYVERRLSLLRLKSEHQKLVDTGKIDLGSAFKIARMPQEDHDDLVKLATHPSFFPFRHAMDNYYHLKQKQLERCMEDVESC